MRKKISILLPCYNEEEMEITLNDPEKKLEFNSERNRILENS